MMRSLSLKKIHQPSIQQGPAASPHLLKKSTHFLQPIILSLGLAGVLGLGCAFAADLPQFEIVARDGRLYPERLEVPAGVKLKLVLRNEGKAPVEFENLQFRLEKVLAPDAASTVTLQALKPGSYTVVDEFHATTGKMLIIAK